MTYISYIDREVGWGDNRNQNIMSLEQLKKRYEIDCKWRVAWATISKNQEHGRLQSKQDKIERRIAITSNRIYILMKEFDTAQ